MINYIIGFGAAAIVLTIIIRKIIKAKKGEVSGCGCGCSKCSFGGTCSMNDK